MRSLDINWPVLAEPVMELFRFSGQCDSYVVSCCDFNKSLIEGKDGVRECIMDDVLVFVYPASLVEFHFQIFSLVVCILGATKASCKVLHFQSLRSDSRLFPGISPYLGDYNRREITFNETKLLSNRSHCSCSFVWLLTLLVYYSFLCQRPPFFQHLVKWLFSSLCSNTLLFGLSNSKPEQMAYLLSVSALLLHAKALQRTSHIGTKH